ncbi:MAG: hypothetical protein QW416_03265 [Candidatus Nitrosocaldaceae archaeon]
MKIYNGFIISILLITPILYADAQIPEIPEFKEVSGRYVNEALGVEVTFPDGWSGMEIPSMPLLNNSILTMVSVTPGSMADISDTNMPIIITLVAYSGEKIKTTQTDTTQTNEPNVELEPKCNILSFETKKVNNVEGMLTEIECNIEEQSVTYIMKMFSVYQEIDDRINSISLMYMANKDVYNDHLNEFDNTLNTLKVSNAKPLSFKSSEIVESVNVEGNNIDIKISSNSKITDFEFDAENKAIAFKAEGENNSIGITDIYLGNVLQGPYTVTINGEAAYYLTITDENGNEGIRIIYTHSIKDVKIIGTHVVPEFPVSILPILALITGVTIFMVRNKSIHKI